jgi:CheY-like chemotaxis protein
MVSHSTMSGGLHGGKPQSDFQAKHVLVVDDYPDNVSSLAALLRYYGQEVDTAFNGQEAIELARVRRPDVVFSDLAMPIMDGYELAHELRKMYGKNIVLIGLTANASLEAKQRSLDAGFNLHLVKPVDLGDLDQILNQQLGAV